ncbi:hypothetical protein FISHEDRAFT_55176 [Fistulina hepatica ATCC 64428]|uniref:Uncharacterized protein n=1 Tax=Fistulina hepatica ATCC 64428 TaxID=1128425 RepID=A0A0D7ANK3_9AGAR|nr:hypothetical protein FISHEDRAFT_55176 [Fistulina hepatica ATCC 64428]
MALLHEIDKWYIDKRRWLRAYAIRPTVDLVPRRLAHCASSAWWGIYSTSFYFLLTAFGTNVIHSVLSSCIVIQITMTGTTPVGAKPARACSDRRSPGINSETTAAPLPSLQLGMA